MESDCNEKQLGMQKNKKKKTHEKSASGVFLWSRHEVSRAFISLCSFQPLKLSNRVTEERIKIKDRSYKRRSFLFRKKYSEITSYGEKGIIFQNRIRQI